MAIATALLFAVSLAAPADSVDVRYVANAGMLVTVDGRRFLIDAPIRDGIPPYATSPAEDRAPLEAARAPFSAIDAILITHWHDDHFSAEAVAAHLAASPQTVLISSPEVVARVRGVAPALRAAQLRAVLPQPGGRLRVEVGGVPVEVLRLRHNPTRRYPEEHLGFLIVGWAPVLHVGDADPRADNFAGLRGLPRPHVALLPFWYLADDANRRMVAQAIRPASVVALHIPPADVTQVAPTLRDAHGRAPVLATPGVAFTIDH